jgi:hypothetical protein
VEIAPERRDGPPRAARTRGAEAPPTEEVDGAALERWLAEQEALAS